ncbi:MAG: Ig-like domain-containing protein [Pedobacter sp.]
MIPVDFFVHIEDATLQWQDVTEQLRSLTDGTSGEADIIPTVTLTFAADIDGSLLTLLNPEINKDRARIRITDGDLVTDYLMEGKSGKAENGLDYPTVTGRAYAGVLDNWRPLSWDWPSDTLCSAMAAQVAHQDMANQGGATVGVIWQATLDPTIPGGRYSVSKKRRRDIIAEIAEACAACVRTSADGRNLEVYDRPSRALTETAARNYANALSLSYQFDRVDEPANAVRVQGEVLDYTRPTLPVVKVTLVPGAIEADGEDTASAVARVYDSAGQPVQHEAVVDEAITAGSYTSIPVSGCFSVQGVWLNTGTQEAPVKGAKVPPTGFDASSITVPDNGTQLFIVSYTRAESVSWSSADVQKQIDGEGHTTSGTLTVSTSNAIGNVRGVYRASDANRTGTNYYTGGSAAAGGTAITLGISPGAAGTAVIIDYDQYEATPSVNISPSSSLCDAEGKATTTIGAGTSVGTVSIVASALGQSGSAKLSLTGDAVGSLSVTADPQTIRAQQSTTAVTTFTAEACQTAADDDGGIYVAVDNLVTYCGQVLLSGYGNAPVLRWTNNAATDDYRIYLMTSAPAGVNATADYTGREVIDEADQTSTITANVLTSAGAAVSDGTEVKFALSGAAGGSTLSAQQQTTSDGQASVTLTAGSVAQFNVVVTVGPYSARVQITVTDQPLAAEQTSSTATGTTSSGYSDTATGDAETEEETSLEDGEYKRADGRVCHLVLKDWEDASGNIRGRRLAKGCDGVLPFAKIIIDGVVEVTTDAEGYFYFSVAAAGSHTATYNNIEKTFSVASGGDMRWTPGSSDRWYEVCRDE